MGNAQREMLKGKCSKGNAQREMHKGKCTMGNAQREIFMSDIAIKIENLSKHYR